MRDAIALLQELGFGEYEARAYQALLQHHPVNGYELAKVSGIPRANVYPVLQKLEERGAVVRLDSEEGTRYQPVPPAELLDAMNQRFAQTVDTARSTLETLNRPVTDNNVWQIEGYANLLAHARALIRSATEGLLVALWPAEATELAGEFAEAEARSVKITTLCMAACAEECGGCRGQIFRNRVIDTQDTRWLLVVPDNETVVAGEITADGEGSAVRTRQRLLVNMVAWFVRHSIALAALVQDLDEQIGQGLSPETQAALAIVGPQSSRDWLTYMRELLSTRGKP